MYMVPCSVLITKNIVDALLQGKITEATENAKQRLSELVEERLADYRVALAARIFPNIEIVEHEETLNEAPRIKIIRLRIRNGKIQRRKKLSNVKGYTLRKGRMVRMSSSERRHRKLGARRARIKRRSKRSRTRMKLRRSLRRRKSMGLKPAKRQHHKR